MSGGQILNGFYTQTHLLALSVKWEALPLCYTNTGLKILVDSTKGAGSIPSALEYSTPGCFRETVPAGSHWNFLLTVDIPKTHFLQNTTVLFFIVLRHLQNYIIQNEVIIKCFFNILNNDINNNKEMLNNNKH